MEKIICATLLALFICNHAIAMQLNKLEKEALKVLNAVISNEKKLPDLDLKAAQKILKQQCSTAQLNLLEKNKPQLQNNLDHQLLCASRQIYNFKEKSNTIFSLIAQGADVNTRCQATNGTTLHWAVTFGHTYNVICLIFAGADVDAQNCNGYTPLYLAAYDGKEIITKLLLKHGAKTDIPDNDGRTPLSRAEQFFHEKLIALLDDSDK